MSSNSCTVRPANELKSSVFWVIVHNRAIKLTFQIKYDGHKAVYFIYARDLINKKYSEDL